MIIYGLIEKSEKTKSAVSVKADGQTLTISGPAKAVTNWTKKLASSMVLANSVKENNVNLRSYAASNSMTDILVFDEDEYDVFRDRFESVKGSKRVIKIDRLPTIDDDDFSQEAVTRFVKRAQKLMK